MSAPILVLLGMGGSAGGALPPLGLVGHLALLGVGRCWWWLAPLTFLLSMGGR